MPVQLGNDCQCAVIDLAAKVHVYDHFRAICPVLMFLSKVSQLHLSAQMSATILDVDRIIMPVHLGNHWTCAVIDLAAKELVYYDSMGVCPYLPESL